MKLKRGSTARITLIDGSTLEGRVVSRWWGPLRLEDVTFHTTHGSTPAAGAFVIPKRSVLFVQVTN